MKIRIEIDEHTLKALVHGYLQKQLGTAAPLDDARIKIQVKSAQNYRSEWETADFRAVYEDSNA